MVGDSDVKAELRRQQREWLREVIARCGESASELAINAGVADVTLTRFLNREDYEGVLSPLVIEKIKRYTGLPGPGELTIETEEVDGFRETRNFDYRAQTQERPVFTAMIEAALAGRPNAAPWLLLTDTLNSVGHLKGDVLISDASVQPRAGDLVVAQISNRRTGQTETAFRIFEPPYLLGFTPETRYPLLVDNSEVIVMGVVTESLRAPQR